MTSQTNAIKNIEVCDIHERLNAKPRFAFLVRVTWTNDCQDTIIRRYSDFMRHQTTILEHFPNPAGAGTSGSSTIPLLPADPLYCRVNSGREAVHRLDMLSKYCQQLLSMPENILRSDVFKHFYIPGISDMKFQRDGKFPDIASPNSTEKNGDVNLNYLSECSWEVNLKLSDKSSIGEKSDTDLVTFVAAKSYKGDKRDELDLEKGDVVTVLEQNNNGWWKVRCKNKEGMVPFAFVCPTGSSHNNTVPNPESSHQQKAEKGEHDNTTDEKYYPKNKISALSNTSNIDKTTGNIVKVVPLNLVTDTPPSSPTSESRTLEHSRRLVDKLSDVKTVDTGVGDSNVNPTPSFCPQGYKKDMKDELNLESVTRQTSSQDYYSNGKLVGKSGPPPPGSPGSHSSRQETIRSQSNTDKLQRRENNSPEKKSKDNARSRLQLTTSLKDSKKDAQVGYTSIDKKEPSDELIKVVGEIMTLEMEETWQAVDDYKATINGGLSITKGEILKVTSKSEFGWCHGHSGKKSGWVPGSFLELCHEHHDDCQLQHVHLHKHVHLHTTTGDSKAQWKKEEQKTTSSQTHS